MSSIALNPSGRSRALGTRGHRANRCSLLVSIALMALSQVALAGDVNVRASSAPARAAALQGAQPKPIADRGPQQGRVAGKIRSGDDWLDRVGIARRKHLLAAIGSSTNGHGSVHVPGLPIRRC